MNAPGGLSVAGYLDCHTRVCPNNFDFHGLEVPDAVMGLVNEIYINDLPELQHGGKLCPVLFISVSRIISSYNNVVRYVITGNVIVMTVMKA